MKPHNDTDCLTVHAARIKADKVCMIDLIIRSWWQGVTADKQLETSHEFGLVAVCHLLRHGNDRTFCGHGFDLEMQ